jgi:general secretion pathway protein M
MRAWFESMQERERRIVIIGAVLAAILVVLGTIMPLDRSVSSARQRVERKQADLQWLQSVGPELAAAGPISAAPANAESMIVLVDRSAREAGLGSALISSEPSGTGGLRVRLEKAPFDTIVGWLARLSEQHGLRVESATIDGAGEAGIVNAGIVLRAR